MNLTYGTMPASRASNGRPRSARTRRSGLLALLLAVFLTGQVSALVHEFEHVLHQHDAPCALHVAAEHLAMASVPVPGNAVMPVPATRAASPSLVEPPPASVRPSGARAPPLLS